MKTLIVLTLTFAANTAFAFNCNPLNSLENPLVNAGNCPQQGSNQIYNCHNVTAKDESCMLVPGKPNTLSTKVLTNTKNKYEYDNPSLICKSGNWQQSGNTFTCGN